MSYCPDCGKEVTAQDVFCTDCTDADDGAVRDLIDEQLGDEETTREFLAIAIDYQQRRLDFVNNKASIFIAIQTGLFVIVTWLLVDSFLTAQGDQMVIVAGSLVFLVLNVGFMVAVVALLLQSIRPSDGYLSMRTGIETVDVDGVLWPGDEIPEPEQFVHRIDSMDRDARHRELVSTVYALQQQVDGTYEWYRPAVWLMKVQVMVVPIGFLVLVCAAYL